MILGHTRQIEMFRAAWDSGTLHHAWLLAGRKGVGKATFARSAATRVLADAAGPRSGLQGIETPKDHPVARLVEAGSHPDLRWLERLENPKTGNLARNITIDQVRGLADLFELTPALSRWRAVVIDAADDLEPGAANALLKMLEEPPADCLFLLVAHAPGRLLPTIRSRCRRLDFQALGSDVIASLLDQTSPALSAEERQRIALASHGSAGRAMALAELDLAPLEQAAATILREGDPTNGRRAALAGELGRKGAGERYAAFLDLLPSLVSAQARDLGPPRRARALNAYARVRELVAAAPRLSLDPAATVFQLGGILASVADPPLP